MTPEQQSAWETDPASRTRDVYAIVSIPEKETAHYYGTYPLVGIDVAEADKMALRNVVKKLDERGDLAGAELIELRTRSRHPSMLVPQDDWWTTISHDKLPLWPLREVLKEGDDDGS